MMKYIKWFVLVLLLGTMTIQSLRVYRDVKNVLSYRPIVEDILAEHDSVSTEDLVLAMIYTETKGQEADLMQSSESSTGVANTITDSRESIRQGVTVLSENLLTSQSKETDIWTAVQAYNFGSSYIDFVAKNGSKNTISLSKKYSRTVVAPSLGNTSGETYRYYNPIALLYGGGALYRNGGNIYYAKQVQFNLVLIKLISHF
ncbi:lysozyme family protein [Streptococcus pluranimalium]|uniref:CwlT-like lysozyme domain-containing protein n=2 Tax=Streptococcus TaxID=1301 RepID=V6Z2L4_STRAG|nr:MULTISPECIES: lysozyme family protein [Streptococcus]ESV54958.1 hypothetical protein SAG0136_06935 [Streptococcus agalactiae LMG 14747]MDY3024274.1 lysozyme family protein [Streptococcus hyovaginalis]MDY4511599.1 lysozyme family protein [Streptococcus hyovaginalis]MDY5974740.1 lysozyme family protein [Streptococcus hyovaginalis]SNV40599.1 transposon-like protein [Streptococcus acidominimus]